MGWKGGHGIRHGGEKETHIRMVNGVPGGLARCCFVLLFLEIPISMSSDVRP